MTSDERAQALISGRVDFQRYLTVDVIADDVLNAVERDLERFRPDVVIAHSFGSRVAVDAIARLPIKQQPALLLTLGSPLAMPAFRPTSSTSLRWLQANAVRWINVYDKADIATGGRRLPHSVYPTCTNVLVDDDDDAWDHPIRSVTGMRHRPKAYARHKRVANEFTKLLRKNSW